MGEVKALQKHACPECGGDAVWNPARQALVCPYCGTIIPGALQPDGAIVLERDLAEALRNVPAGNRGWQAEKISVKCQSCQAISVFDKDRAAQRCDFCGSPSIVPYAETRDPIRPESRDRIQFRALLDVRLRARLGGKMQTRLVNVYGVP